VHGAAHAAVRTPSTTAALAALERSGLLPGAGALTERHRFLRRVSTALRLLGARPTDTLELAGPMPARVAAALGFASRDPFLAAYREHAGAVREAYDDALNAERTHAQRSHEPPGSGHPRPEPGSRSSLQ